MPRKISLILLGIFAPVVAHACGPWFSEHYLSNGGELVLSAPEFYFELEMKQLATNYPSSFKAVKNGPVNSTTNATPNASGSPSTNQPVTSSQESELYRKGADAFKAGHLVEAQSVWKELLALPENERHAYSIPAAYMLGRSEIKRHFAIVGATEEESPDSETPTPTPSPSAQDHALDNEAVVYFRQVRDLAQKGFDDPNGLAAASLGWEAYVELHRDDYEKAATLYLQQLSAGDPGALSSLSFLADKLTDNAASNPLLRRIRTAEILCYAARSDTWLDTLEKQNVDHLEEADQLGWVAYSAGKFDQAKRWLNKSDPNTWLALWLRAKLLMRDGKVSESTLLMAKANKQMPPGAKLDCAPWELGRPMPVQVAAGDLGMVQLSHGEFKEAFHSFLQGGYHNDTDYVAERVLTVNELKSIVDQEFKALPEDEKPVPTRDLSLVWESEVDNRVKLRWLLARRLARQGDFLEARPYFPIELREGLDRYAADLKQAHNKNAKSEDRARAFFDAAIIAHSEGMELMGTAVEPDFEVYDGEYSEPGVVSDRLRGKYGSQEINPNPNGTGATEITATKKLVLPVSESERERLLQNAVEPEKRFHYRYIAANLAWRAAKLLPNNSEITADVLNTAGTWLKERDEAAADRFVQAIENRCPDTEIGKAVLKKHWFTDQKGPWSSAVPAP